jgi:hypothetical protein
MHSAWEPVDDQSKTTLLGLIVFARLGSYFDFETRSFECLPADFGLVWFGFFWGSVQFGVVWCGVVWSGLVWFGLVWFGFRLYQSTDLF